LPVLDGHSASARRFRDLVNAFGALRFRATTIAAHGANYAMPSLLDPLAAPGCLTLGCTWDRCGVHYVEPMEG